MGEGFHKPCNRSGQNFPSFAFALFFVIFCYCTLFIIVGQPGAVYTTVLSLIFFHNTLH